MPEICLNGVSKVFAQGLFKKKISALQNVSFEIRHGEVFGLVGPNGAGKSTTIRLILGLIRPDQGVIHFRGKIVKSGKSHKDIGYLPESPFLYHHLTLEELLCFCGKTSGLSSSVTVRRGAELMDKLDLIENSKRPLRTFSKGMLQRAGLCFALLHDPAVVILDEPMSGLDPVGRKMVFDLVTEFKNKGKTIFFCSHILNDVERLCDRIGIMDNGRLLKILGHETFIFNGGKRLHLVVKRLDKIQRQIISPLVTHLSDDFDKSILSFPLSSFLNIACKLKEIDVDVLDSRSEKPCLEDLFMETIEA